MHGRLLTSGGKYSMKDRCGESILCRRKNINEHISFENLKVKKMLKCKWEHLGWMRLIVAGQN